MNYIRHVFPMLAFTASMLLGVSIAVTPAAAATITYSFSGQVDKVQNQIEPSHLLSIRAQRLCQAS